MCIALLKRWIIISAYFLCILFVLEKRRHGCATFAVVNDAFTSRLQFIIALGIVLLKWLRLLLFWFLCGEAEKLYLKSMIAMENESHT